MAWIAVFLLALVILAVGIVVQGVSLYNGLVQVKHQVDRSWSNIDVLLKQRHVELPKLIDAVKGYMTHERALLENVTALRVQAKASNADAQRLANEVALSRGVSQLLAVAENYPQLRACEVFLDLQTRSSALEEQIAHRREFYNAAININNVRMEQFPDNLLASYVGLESRPLFESKEAEREGLDLGLDGAALSAIAEARGGNADAYVRIFETNKPMLGYPDRICPGQMLRIAPV